MLFRSASAINPYLAHESIKQLIDTDMLQKDYYAAVKELNQIKDTGDVYTVSRERAAVLKEAGVAEVAE